MNINFTGINNIISKTHSHVIGSFETNSRSCFKSVNIKMELNDIGERDFQEFEKSLKKSATYCQQNCLNKNEPDKLELICTNITESYKPDENSSSSFNINGTEIVFDEDGVLPLFTYIAKITKKISKNQNIPIEEREAAKFINNKIQQEANRYFDIKA